MKLTLDEIVSLTGGRLIRTGEGAEVSAEVSGVASLDEADRGDVSFLGNEKYYQDYLQTKAGVVLVPAEVPADPAPADSVSLIQVENPSFVFGQVVKHFVDQGRKFSPGVHPGAHVAEDVDFDSSKVCIKAGAVIEAGVKIGPGTEIGPGVVIGAGVSIGEDCLFYANSSVREGCIIGNRVVLQPGCVIGSDGYGYELVDGRHEKVDQVGIVLVEDDVEIGANTTVDRARFGKTVIGEGSKIDNQVQIAHNVRIGKHCLVVSQAGVAGSSHLGDYVTIAAQAGVGGHIKIEDRAILASRGGALKNLKAGVVYQGFPARPIMEEKKKMAALTRLPKLLQEVKELRRRLDELEST